MDVIGGYSGAAVVDTIRPSVRVVLEHLHPIHNPQLS